MSKNLIESVWGYFDDQLVNKAAGYLGESSNIVRKSLEYVIPITLAGIVKKVDTGDEGSLLTLAKDAYKRGIFTHLKDTFSQDHGGVPSFAPVMIGSLFGDKIGAIQNAIAGNTQCKGVTVASLFGTVVPLALAIIGKDAVDGQMTPGGVASWLLSQKSSILSAIPSSFNFSSYFTDPVAPVTSSVQEKKKTNWLMPLLLLLLAGAILWWFLGKNKEEVTVEKIVHDTLLVDNNSIKIMLPSGVEITARKGGMEELLIAFIKDSLATPGNDNWFDFNNLNFVFGTAEIVPESKKQLGNIIEILKAYPKVKVKIGGYTDRVGSPDENKKLSQERADAVALAFKEAGVGGQITDAEGYGSEFAKFPADAPEIDRIKDRRVSLSVREK